MIVFVTEERRSSDWAYEGRGSALLQLGRSDEAIADLQAAGDSITAQHNLGMAMFKAGRYGEAAAALGQALDEDSHDEVVQMR